MDAHDGDALLRENQELKGRIAQLEQQLRESRGASAFLESVLIAVPAFITNLDPELRIRFLNRYQPGHSLESVVGADVFDYMAEEDREIARENIERARSTGEVTSYTLHKAVGPNGAPASYLTRVAPVREPDGRVGVCLAFVDITAEAERERALHEMQEQLGLALDATGLGLWTWDLATDTSSWDARMCALHGSDEALPPGRYTEQLVHPEDREILTRSTESTLASGSLPPTLYRIVRPDGAIRWLIAVGRILYDETGAMVKMMGGNLDVTRTRELEEQLRKSQKMEALANLTAGVAHNFNNMLAVITPILELTTPMVPKGHRKLLEGASHAARRAAELVQHLMTYAGQSTADLVVSDVATLVNAAVEICRRSFGAQISLNVEHFPEPLAIACSPGQIEQVLVNLLINARDAIEEAHKSGGNVKVSVRADASAQLLHVDVADDGPGMSPSTLARLFEPFFTTKPVGKGTGLGLATSFAIAREHQGTLTCTSSSAEGTCFRLTLPLVSEAPAAPVKRHASQPPPGTELLLVDDDEGVRNTLAHVLGAAGLRVHEASSGPHALEVLRAKPTTQVVLLDRSMPGGAGENFIPAIRELAPEVRVILISGRAIEADVAGLVDAVVPKPATASVLTSAIEHVLSSPRRA